MQELGVNYRAEFGVVRVGLQTVSAVREMWISWVERTCSALKRSSSRSNSSCSWNISPTSRHRRSTQVNTTNQGIITPCYNR